MRVLLPACLSLLLGSAFAQTSDGNTLPISTVPLLQTPPAIQFVALARERGPKQQKDWSDMQVTLWEIQPSRAKHRAVRRRVLGRSHWNASPLLDSAELLRWQVPGAAGQRGYKVKLLRVDGRTFEIKELLHTRQAAAFARAANTIYLNTSDGQCMLDVATDAIAELQPAIRLLAQHGDDWLVASGGVLARFDAAKQAVVRRYEDLAVADDRQSRALVHWHGGRFAVSFGRYLDDAGKVVHALDFGRPGIVYRELRIWNLQIGKERKLRVRMQAVGGSGVGVIPSPVQTELRGAKFRYTERTEAGVDEDLTAFDWERDTEWVTIEIATGKELLREPYAASPAAAEQPSNDHHIPEYLRSLFAQSPIRAWGPDQDLAHAFLVHVGIDPELATSGVIKLGAVCRSPDGQQLLVLNHGRFYHCNLKTKAVKQWQAPEALAKANVELHAVAVR
tara:strand:+ start:1948 stop:3294 length:1347 start_codon:yes stop_codon:yes gene_type:complete